MKGVALALCSVLLVSLAQLLLRVAMRNLPSPETWLQHGQFLLLLGTGLGAYALSMLCWIVALRYMPLNRLYPLLSLSYVLVWLAAIAIPVLGESFRWSSFAGVLLILLGVTAITLPQKQKGQVS
ncbi:4-amino-4-deoxy-L-arabinose-phosphoundecaprenol flippase subunit ArnF [Pantoea sp. KPR_PJ]|uniref:4-amino-4-deoxy-L-arabinose-phosphoundecaprenol flippase subunit ArnF n=1 Tax=Pantoea sp. KPR_PJ TaxID=2738375 RepID=UPI0035291F11